MSASDNVRVVVVISGGMLRSVYGTNPNTEVILLDYDNIEDDPEEADFDEQLASATNGLKEIW